MSAISLKVGLTRMVVLALLVAVIAPVLAVGVPAIVRAGAVDPCGTGGNPVSCENSKPGDPMANWQVTGVGDTSIQGFATSMSVNLGQTENFKVQTTASSWHIDILRLGYYGGDGARLIASRHPAVGPSPQTQPSCISTASTGLIDCGNWAVSASWTVPTHRGLRRLHRHLVRNDTGGKSQIPFVVRDDASHSDILYQTSDETWEAYNDLGRQQPLPVRRGAGRHPSPATRTRLPPGNPQGYQGAFAVSYNRPLAHGARRQRRVRLFNAEFPMIEFLEKNGYDVSYTSEADVDANGSLLLNHKVFISSGHDEYWSANQAHQRHHARDHGVNLAFFSGNEVFWKTRWDASTIDASTPYRTLITYKETHFNAPTDPQDPATWTGTWADPLQPARRRRRPGERAHGSVLRGQRRHDRHPGAVPVRAKLRLAEHRGGQPRRRADRHPRQGPRHPRLRVGRRRRQRVPPSGRDRPVLDHRERQRADQVFNDYGSPRGAGNGHASPEPLQGGQRRLSSAPAPCSGRLRARQHQRRTRRIRASPTRTCSSSRSTCSRYGRAADHPDLRAWCPAQPPPPPRPPPRRSPRRSGRNAHRRRPGHHHAEPPPTPAAASWPASRSRPTAATPGTPRRSPPARPPYLVLHLAGRARQPDRRPSSPAPPTTAATSRRPPTPSTVNINCPCSIWGSGFTPAVTDSGDGYVRRGRREVHLRHVRHDQRDQVLQVGGQHRDPCRQPVDGRRPAAGVGHVHRARRRPVGSPSASRHRSDPARHHLRRFLLRPQGPLRGRRLLPLRNPQPATMGATVADSPPLHAVRSTATNGVTASTPTAAPVPSPPPPTPARTTGSTSPSPRSPRPGRPPT